MLYRIFNEIIRDLAYLNSSAEVTTICLALELRSVIRSKTKYALFVSPNLLICIMYCYWASKYQSFEQTANLLLTVTEKREPIVLSVVVQHTEGHVLTTVGRDRPISISLRKQWAFCEPLKLRVLLIFLPDAYKATDKSDCLRRC